MELRLVRFTQIHLTILNFVLVGWSCAPHIDGLPEDSEMEKLQNRRRTGKFLSRR